MKKKKSKSKEKNKFPAKAIKKLIKNDKKKRKHESKARKCDDCM